MQYDAIKKTLLSIIEEFRPRGPGYSQEKPVLDEAGQQQLLTCWHDLFREGVLCWGFNLSNPGPPFVHVARR